MVDRCADQGKREKIHFIKIFNKILLLFDKIFENHKNFHKIRPLFVKYFVNHKIINKNACVFVENLVEGLIPTIKHSPLTHKNCPGSPGAVPEVS